MSRRVVHLLVVLGFLSSLTPASTVALAAPPRQEEPAPALPVETPVETPDAGSPPAPEVSPADAAAFEVPPSPIEQMLEDADPASVSASPPNRATRYTAQGGITYGHQTYFSPASPMTVEAWVYRFDDSGCETVLDRGFGTGYWFGTCPRPRFDVAGGFATADMGAEVHRYQWTHVAVSYDGVNASFYVNGVAAGVVPLSSSPPVAGELTVGANQGSNYMNGAMDEIRIWGVARTQAQIQSGMYLQIRQSGVAQGLLAAFGDGGRNEDLHTLAGSVGTGIDAVKWGVLPRDLIAPRAPITPTLDGQTSLDFEYAGAEAMPVRMVAYGSGNETPAATDEDFLSYFVYTETDLWIGIPSASLFAVSWDLETSFVALLLDPNYSRETTIQPTDFRLKIPVNDQNPATAVWQIGDGAGGFMDCTAPSCPQRGAQWDVAKDLWGDDVGPMAMGVEIRISKSLLGEWSEVDGMALGQFQQPPAQGFVAPLRAEDQSPATWGVLSYGDDSASLPRAIVSGKVVNYLAPGAPPMVGHKVYFGKIGTISYERVTDASGNFSFDVRMPANSPLTLRGADCSSCRWAPAVMSGFGINPLVVGSQTVSYPACGAGVCSYRSATLNLKLPPGEVTTISPPGSPVAELVLNTTTGEATSATQFVLKGTNLHDELTVFLSPDNANTDSSKWVLYPAAVVSRSQDMTSLTLDMPTLGKSTPTTAPNSNIGSTLGVQWRWVIRDNWSRQGWKDNYRTGTFRLATPPFPKIYGFGFDNADDNGSYYEFLSVYGDNAYICIGLFGFCATHIIDPIYASVYFGLYKLMISQSGGSCVGLASTSLLMRAGDIPSNQIDPAINFAYGFKSTGSPPQWHFDGSLGFLTSPPEPVDLWAHVRRNHGVQLSGQMWGIIVEQLIDSGTDGFMQRQRDRIASGPTSYVLSMKNPDKVFGGHAVTPYATNGNRVMVYDNNRSGNDGTYVDFNTGDDTFTFPRSSGQWVGGTLFTFPLERWRSQRNFPTNITGMLSNMVFGEGTGGTTALFSTPAGEWGVRPDGVFVDTIPGAVGIPLLGQSGEGVPFSPVLLPMNAPAPVVRINARDSEYQALSGQGGTSLAVQASNVTPGAVDEMALSYAGGALNGFDLKPQLPSSELMPKLGAELGPQQRLLFRLWQMDIGQGGTASLRLIPGAKAMTYGNESNEQSEYQVIVDVVDGAAQKYDTRIFGPLKLPAGGVHRLSVADWPAGTTLKVEIDANGDGTFEGSQNVTGRSCISQDTDEDGLPDACALDRTNYMPVIKR